MNLLFHPFAFAFILCGVTSFPDIRLQAYRIVSLLPPEQDTSFLSPQVEIR
jgi:hypothetical protein